MNLIHILVPVAVGALIGYCTNYIAIKMLFRPKNEIRIGNWKVPFTPGVIPKNKARLARAAGDAVGNKLITDDDISRIFCGDELKSHIVKSFADKIFDEELKVSELAEELSGKDFDSLSMRASVIVSEKIKDGAKSIDFSTIIGDVAGKTLSEKFSGTMISMFLNESTIAMIVDPIGEVFCSYIEENGAETIYPIVKGKVDEMGDKSLIELIHEIELDRECIEAIIERLYMTIMENHVADLVAFIDVNKIVEDKINAMSTDDLEDLVMSVMKNELQTIINLGALIGAVIGLLNLFIL